MGQPRYWRASSGLQLVAALDDAVLDSMLNPSQDLGLEGWVAVPGAGWSLPG